MCAGRNRLRAWSYQRSPSGAVRLGFDHGKRVNMNPKRRYTRNEKIFYALSLLIVFSMVLSLIYVAITPAGTGF
jgi:hypothetical protein